MSVSVCLSVCLSVRVCLYAIISSELHVRSSPIFVRVTYCRGSVLLGQRSDMLCTSGFMDDVIFAYKLRLLGVAVEAQCTRSVGLGYKLCAVIPFAGQRSLGTTFRALKVTTQVATRGRSLRSMTTFFWVQATSV